MYEDVSDKLPDKHNLKNCNMLTEQKKYFGSAIISDICAILFSLFCSYLLFLHWKTQDSWFCWTFIFWPVYAGAFFVSMNRVISSRHHENSKIFMGAVIFFSFILYYPLIIESICFRTKEFFPLHPFIVITLRCVWYVWLLLRDIREFKKLKYIKLNN
jgi:CDP-diglyceride synthetase